MRQTLPAQSFQRRQAAGGLAAGLGGRLAGGGQGHIDGVLADLQAQLAVANLQDEGTAHIGASDDVQPQAHGLPHR
jgi:hypothetical protein